MLQKQRPELLNYKALKVIKSRWYHKNMFFQKLKSAWNRTGIRDRFYYMVTKQSRVSLAQCPTLTSDRWHLHSSSRDSPRDIIVKSSLIVKTKNRNSKLKFFNQFLHEGYIWNDHNERNLIYVFDQYIVNAKEATHPMFKYHLKIIGSIVTSFNLEKMYFSWITESKAQKSHLCFCHTDWQYLHMRLNFLLFCFHLFK